MVRDFLEFLLYFEMEQVVLARGSQQVSGKFDLVYGSDGGGEGFFNRGGWGNWGRVFFSFMEVISFGGVKRKSVEVSEAVDISVIGVEFGDDIEMVYFGYVELLVKGYDFVLQQLFNLIWCDECGDFIWGLYKYCFRCKCK